MATTKPSSPDEKPVPADAASVSATDGSTPARGNASVPPQVQPPKVASGDSEHVSAPATSPSRTLTPKSSPSVGQLFATLSTQISTLLQGEIELTKVKAADAVKKLGLGGGLLAAAGVFALYLLGWIFHTIELAIALVLPAWAASLIVLAVLLLIVLILALVGKARLKAGQAAKPDPKSGLNTSVDAFKKGLRHE
ncbi:MAG: hypothetical protein CSA82_02665 [Actinobacteria bacterium]|nr:MAG: hypothetical protein CSA82_02665 [Actinomycetota bacterium]